MQKKFKTVRTITTKKVPVVETCVINFRVIKKHKDKAKRKGNEALSEYMRPNSL